MTMSSEINEKEQEMTVYILTRTSAYMGDDGYIIEAVFLDKEDALKQLEECKGLDDQFEVLEHDVIK